MNRTAARKSLTTFFVLLVPLAGLAHVLVIRNGMSLPLVAYAMWTPAMASILTRIIHREGFRDVSFVLRGPAMGRAMVLAILFPCAVGMVAYGGAWASGLVAYSWTSPPFLERSLGPLPSPVGFLVSLIVLPVVTFPLSALLAFGEELGWRGFMLQRLVEAELPCPVLLSGVIWGIYHVPIILSGQYDAAGSTGALAVLPFMVGIIAAAYVFAALRLATGSVWPAVVLHAVYNSTMQDVFDRALTGPSHWLGEAGYLLVGVEAVAAYLVWTWFRRRYRRGGTPGLEWRRPGLC